MVRRPVDIDQVLKDFNQAQSLQRQLLEGIGGSSNAYDTPRADLNPEAAPVKSINPAPEIESYNCMAGFLPDKELARVCNGPDPINGGYTLHGTVEDAGELLSLYNGFEKTIEAKTPQTVRLETGLYQIQKVISDSRKVSWRLIDSVKGFIYLQENVRNEAVEEGDLFIWVMPEANPDTDLGYIHEGYVFLPRK